MIPQGGMRILFAGMNRLSRSNPLPIIFGSLQTTGRVPDDPVRDMKNVGIEFLRVDLLLLEVSGDIILPLLDSELQRGAVLVDAFDLLEVPLFLYK